MGRLLIIPGFANSGKTTKAIQYISDKIKSDQETKILFLTTDVIDYKSRFNTLNNVDVSKFGNLTIKLIKDTDKASDEIIDLCYEDYDEIVIDCDDVYADHISVLKEIVDNNDKIIVLTVQLTMQGYLEYN